MTSNGPIISWASYGVYWYSCWQRRWLSTASSEKKEAQGRFVSPKKRMDEYEKAFCPQNTKVNTHWAVNNFSAWQRDYNTRHPEKPCPDDLLLSDSASDVASWLEKYVLSTRKKTGEPYLPKMVYLLLCGLQCYMKEEKVCAMNIFDRNNPDFKRLYYTCDNYFWELRANGVGSQSRPTEVLTPADEEKLWQTGVLSVETPKGLLNAVFFYNGKNFMLRGGAEHCELKFSQLTRDFTGDGLLCFTYTENHFKNRCRGFNQLDIENKVVEQFQDLRAGDRCHTCLLHLYISKVPDKAIEQDILLCTSCS